LFSSTSFSSEWHFVTFFFTGEIDPRNLWPLFFYGAGSFSEELSLRPFFILHWSFFFFLSPNLLSVQMAPSPRSAFSFLSNALPPSPLFLSAEEEIFHCERRCFPPLFNSRFFLRRIFLLDSPRGVIYTVFLELLVFSFAGVFNISLFFQAWTFPPLSAWAFSQRGWLPKSIRRSTRFFLVIDKRGLVFFEFPISPVEILFFPSLRSQILCPSRSAELYINAFRPHPSPCSFSSLFFHSYTTFCPLPRLWTFPQQPANSFHHAPPPGTPILVFDVQVFFSSDAVFYETH